MAAYKYANGARGIVPADVAGKELKRLTDKHGTAFRPQVLVDESRPKRAPLHPHFEWNDAIAAEKFREEQAGGLIRCVVLADTGDENSDGVRAFVSLKIDNQRPCYVPIEVAAANSDYMSQLLSQAEHEMDSFSRRFDRLKAYSEFFTPLLQARKAIADLSAKTRHKADKARQGKTKPRGEKRR